MSSPHRRKSKSIDPEIVVSGVSGMRADAALKYFIDDWFVPALVEEYIRQRHRPSNPVCGGADYQQKPENGDER